MENGFELLCMGAGAVMLGIFVIIWSQWTRCEEQLQVALVKQYNQERLFIEEP